MNPKEFDPRWNVLAAEVMVGMKDWRAAHPRATLREIEAALDERLAHMRARMLEDLALASPAADWAGWPESERPVCPDCGQPLARESQHTRQLQTHGGQTLTLDRRYATCPRCGAGLFPPG
jgi:hypothetical protein